MQTNPQDIARIPSQCSQLRGGPTVWFLACLLLGQALAGCGSDQNQNYVPPVITPPRPSEEAWHGYFSGTVFDGENARYGEALLTVDGAVRIYVGGPSGGTFDPEDSKQLIGQFEVDGDQAFGTGVIIGQHCAVDPGPFCTAPLFGEIGITVATRNLLSGHIRVTTSDGEETWTFEMSWPTSTYREPATMALAEGQYEEELAEFAHGGDVIINVDGAGEMFFQSSGTGCTGNGTLSPFLNGKHNVYDVALTIDSCTGAYAYLNGEFEGLGTRSWGGGWGDWLLIWLASPDGAPSPVAITMWGSYVSDLGPWDY
ncbi:MAG: hypothetical protein ABFS02_09265 [Pseudomonadota bacterium]